MEKGFKCEHCRSFVSVTKFVGTAHRNHCPFCLWSKHIDQKFAGDRKAACLGLMEPVGLTFKEEGKDKYGKIIQGELMVVSRCVLCYKFSINRIAADDEPKAILELFEKSLKIEKDLPAGRQGLKKELEKMGIRLLKEEDREEIKVQLFGKEQLVN